MYNCLGRSKPVLLFSGKRKSGKDFICEKLRCLIGDDDCCIIRISEPLKKIYADRYKLELHELLSDGPYKEQYRLFMINWSEEVRETDPGFFCRAACEKASTRKTWIVSDVRRKTDIQWFRDNYGDIKTIRIYADSDVRKSRGWVFTKGVDDIASECDLDDFNSWDMEFTNNDTEDCQKIIETILKIIPRS